MDLSISESSNSSLYLLDYDYIFEKNEDPNNYSILVYADMDKEDNLLFEISNPLIAKLAPHHYDEEGYPVYKDEDNKPCVRLSGYRKEGETTLTCTSTSNVVEFIGACVGKGVEALAYSKGLTAYIAGVEEIGKSVSEEDKKTVLVMMNVPSAESPTIYTFGKGTYMNEMLETIGAKNAFGDQEGWLSVSVEDAIKANPDVILMDCNWMPDAADQVKALEGWENVNAIKNGAVYAVNEDLCSQPNWRVGEAIIEWAKFIYADKFKDFSLGDAIKDGVDAVLG